MRGLLHMEQRGVCPLTSQSVFKHFETAEPKSTSLSYTVKVEILARI